MKRRHQTHPNTPRRGVFILESNKIRDEADEHYEGRILSQILNMSGVPCKYYYFRTRKELSHLLRLFGKTRFRYLHIACHGSRNRMWTTFESLSFHDLAVTLAPYMESKRLFLSACSMANTNLADELFTETHCRSLMGPATIIYFPDAAVFWSGFYRIMLRTRSPMSRREIARTAKNLAITLNVKMNYFGRKSKAPRGYAHKRFQ